MIENRLLSKTFFNMAIGLLITFFTGFFASSNERIVTLVATNPGFLILLCILEFILVIVLSAKITDMTPGLAKGCFVLYSVVSGLTMSVIFLTYEMTSIINILLLSAAVFVIFAFLGYTTKTNLSKLGNILLTGLIIAIIVEIINMFIGISALGFGLDVVVLVIMIGFVAYDMQKLKELQNLDIDENNLSVLMVLSLYLDFINIFLRLLNMSGNRK